MVATLSPRNADNTVQLKEIPKDGRNLAIHGGMRVVSAILYYFLRHKAAKKNIKTAST